MTRSARLPVRAAVLSDSAVFALAACAASQAGRRRFDPGRPLLNKAPVRRGFFLLATTTVRLDRGNRGVLLAGPRSREAHGPAIPTPRLRISFTSGGLSQIARGAGDDSRWRA